MLLFRWRRRRRHELSTQEDRASGSGQETAPTPPAVPPEDLWRPVASEFAERVLMLTWAAVSQLAEVESLEQDPERLRRLYHTDHALTRIRRVAENVQVLAGVHIEDPGRQITTVLDVVRAAASAVEHYQRIRLGRIVDLAIAEIAADDVIRILTELVDNAIRYSPPGTPVTVAAHLTDAGHVLVRVEDSGIGVNPADLPRVNDMLDGGDPPSADALRASHLGLPVVARLVRRHRSLRVQLTPHQPAGTTAMLLVGGELVCEVPPSAAPAPVAPPPARQPVTRPTGPTDVIAGAVVPVQRHPGAPMPRRVPGSVRGPDRPDPPSGLPEHRTTWHDDAADFNAGVDSAARSN